jgi:hypothetical protein
MESANIPNPRDIVGIKLVKKECVTGYGIIAQKAWNNLTNIMTKWMRHIKFLKTRFKE